MYNRDYIMRMIEQITNIIGKQLLSLKKEEKHNEVLIVINELYLKLSLPSSKLLQSISAEHIMEMMSRNGVVDEGRIRIIALLLVEEGDAFEKLSQKEKALQNYNKALKLCEIAGMYSIAEDMLFDVLETSACKELIPEGIQFYERLLKKTDEELLAGNLPRNEILDALEELQVMKH